jgi:hypothetical protein
LRQDFGGTKRSSSEQRLQTLVGRSGAKGDEGGHFVAHRFMGDQGLKNLFPQNFNFNRSAFKKMENFFASQIQQGREVRYRGALHGGDRPTSVGIEFEILSNGSVVESGKFRFANEAGQAFR